MKYLRLFENFENTEVIETLREILFELSDEDIPVLVKDRYDDILVKINYRGFDSSEYFENEISIKDINHVLLRLIKYMSNYKFLMDIHYLYIVCHECSSHTFELNGDCRECGAPRKWVNNKLVIDNINDIDKFINTKIKWINLYFNRK